MLWISASFETINKTMLFLLRTTKKTVFSTVLTLNVVSGQSGVERRRRRATPASRNYLPNDVLQDKYEVVILVWRIFSGCLSRKWQYWVLFILELGLWIHQLWKYFQDFFLWVLLVFIWQRHWAGGEEELTCSKCPEAWTTFKCRSGFKQPLIIWHFVTVLEMSIYDQKIQSSWKVEMLLESLHICNAAQAFDSHRKELSELKHVQDGKKRTLGKPSRSPIIPNSSLVRSSIIQDKLRRRGGSCAVRIKDDNSNTSRKTFGLRVLIQGFSHRFSFQTITIKYFYYHCLL